MGAALPYRTENMPWLKATTGCCHSLHCTLKCVMAAGFINSSPPGQNGPHFPDNIFRCLFMNENFYNLIPISLKFVPKGLIDNIQTLVQIKAPHWQAIIWACDGLFTDAYASLSLNELSPMMSKIYLLCCQQDLLLYQCHRYNERLWLGVPAFLKVTYSVLHKYLLHPLNPIHVWWGFFFGEAAAARYECHI